MKRVKILLILLISFIAFDFQNVNAASGYLSVSATQVYVGDSFTVSAVVSSTAAWNVHVSASGPVSGCSINQVDATSDAMNTNKTFSATCTATSTGTISITLSGDVTDASDGNAVSIGGTKTVSVVNRPVTPTPSNPTPSTPTPSGPADTRSTNTGLSKLTINGKEVANVNNVFTIEVSNYVDKVDIAAVVADSKAKVSGTGSKDLKVGENNFSVVVTAERGNTTTYTVKVIRKEYNILIDLEELVKVSSDAVIQISDDDKITKEQLDTIIDSKKRITLSKIDAETKKILYSFILDGNSIKSVNEFNPNIILVIEDNSDMEEALNYADGIYLDFRNCGDVPKGIILRYFVGDKYKENDKINLYSYNGDKVIQLKENITVTDGYIEFNVDEDIRHLISKAKVINAEVKSSNVNIWFIVSIVLTVISICLFIMLITSRMKNSSKKEKEAKEEKQVVEVKEERLVEQEKVASVEVQETPVVEAAETYHAEVKTEDPVIVSEVKPLEKLNDNNEMK